MIINGSEFQDPDDFEIKPRTATNARRALSGKVFGSRREMRDELSVTFETMTHQQATSLKSILYEQTAIGNLDLFFKRASSSDITGCTNAFKGVVEYVSESMSTEVDLHFSRNLTFTFHIHSYEAF